ncbi:MAG: S9 family peptidase, partial [Candidatus Aminicenantaceae bacterium]
MRNKVLTLTIIFMLAFLPACQKQGGESQEQLTYPVSKKIDVLDDYFGTKVEDPYRWMEDDTSDEVKSWVEEQNVVTFGYLEKIPYREKISQRLT